ncbi:unnamed protein product [Ambrosiozyma monospora]|uniref:Unnamed protein product n=1 Tax=Ambrosiozyma monospora TaxID=43982 RepID=A0A9W6Z2W7_AMBMO|nr:unnamed protein product [Ambrosiozyma monospora]
MSSATTTTSPLTQLTLAIAGKSQQLDYPSIIASSFIKSTASVKITYSAEKAINNAPSQLSDSTGAVLATGPSEILSYFADKFPKDLLSCSASKDWVKFALEKFYVKDFKKLSLDLEELEQHLNFRSFMLGHKITLADIAVWGVLRANPVMGSTIKNDLFINISRWYTFLESDARFSTAAENLSAALKKNASDAKGKKGEKKVHKANFEIDLPGAAKGKVVTRFPPEPSGYLHIGKDGVRTIHY